MRYRRADVTGGTYFFTVNLAERKRILLVDHVDVLRAVMQKVKPIWRQVNESEDYLGIPSPISL